MKNIKKLTLIILSLLLLPTISLAGSSSASIFFTAPSTVHVGDTFSALVAVDTAGVLINSVNVSLTYDTNLTSFVGYKDDNTLVKIWIEAPHASDGTISMSGIIPGGVSGLYDPNKTDLSPIPLVKLLFVAKGAGEAKLSFTQTQILENDGKGTALTHEQKDSDVLISKADSLVKLNNVLDEKPPLPFTITFLESSFFGRTPDMIIFETTDVDSGIKGYKMNIDGGIWQDVKSPQPIMKSLFARDITVRAFDFYGNFQDANLTIPGLVPLPVLWLVFILLLLSGILGFKLLKYKA